MSEPATPLDAGELGTWLDGLRDAIAGRGDSDVPCGDCTACCRAAQFVPVEPDEHDTLAAIAPELLFPAPLRPAGHFLLGYDEHGRCPMLGDRGCTIYEHRPRACRTYDCRVFAAAGVLPDEPAKADVAARAARWRFRHEGSASRARHEAVQAAARFVAAHAAELSDGGPPPDATRLAVLAVELHEHFVDAEPTVDEIAVVLRTRHDR